VEELTHCHITEVWNHYVTIKFQIIRRSKNVDMKISTVYTVEFLYFVLKNHVGGSGLRSVQDLLDLKCSPEIHRPE
jgi:hypothetical protein